MGMLITKNGRRGYFGNSAIGNLAKRFGDPPHFSVRYENPAGEVRARRLDDVFYGYRKILTSLLGREPSEGELYGFEKIKGTE